MPRLYVLPGLVALVMAALPAMVAAAPPAAGEVTAEASLTRGIIRVGDQVGLRVLVTHHHQTLVEFPPLYDRLGVPEVLAMRQQPSTRHLDGTQVSVMEYTITAFALGAHRLPTIAVSYVDPQGERGSATTTQELTLEVVSVLVNLPDEGLRDIKPPLAIPLDPLAYAYPASLLVLGVGVLGLSMLLYRRWRRRAEGVAAPAAPLHPAEAARQELAQVANLDLLQWDGYPAYYSLISTTVRRYLDARLGLYALGSTTQELRATMEARGLDRWQARVITGLLEECDAAKWAHYHPAEARAQRAITLAFEVIDLVEQAVAGPPREPVTAGEG